MGFDLVVTLLSTAVTWIFTALAFREALQRRKVYHFIWTIGLASFAVAVSAEFVLAARGAWSESLYRIWYLCGAMFGVVFLGQGTAHLLLARSGIAKILLVLVLLFSAAGAYVTLTAPVDLARLETPAEPSGKAFPAMKDAGFATPRSLTPFLNLYGTFWLVGGAGWSAVRWWRRDRRSARVAGNALIAAGALVVGGASSLNRFGVSGYQYIGEFIGITLMFMGFLRMSAQDRPAEQSTWPSGSY